MKKTIKKSDLPKVDKMFRFNVGKKGIIFNKYHPYFTELEKDYKGLLKVNFGLPLWDFGSR